MCFYVVYCLFFDVGFLFGRSINTKIFKTSLDLTAGPNGAQVSRKSLSFQPKKFTSCCSLLVSFKLASRTRLLKVAFTPSSTPTRLEM